jgi:hypothetical protein
VKVTGLDEAGEIVWRPDPIAAFAKSYVDAEGKPTIAPWAHAVKSDSRLKAGESREVRVAGVPERVTSVRALLAFRTIAPFLAEKLQPKPPEVPPPPEIPATVAEVSFAR